MVDLDKQFSYDTRQLVKIRDRKLGLTLQLLYFLLLTWIALGVFVFGQGYLSFDQTKGGIATHVKGDTVALSANSAGGARYYSAEEITYPGLENGNVFVATRERVTKQTRGTCDDHSMPCTTDSDCTSKFGGTCSKHGYCHELGWCPVDGEEPELYDLDTMDVQIWVKSFVHYSLLDRKSARDPFTDLISTGLKRPFIYSTINQNHTKPEHGYNLFSVGELLRKCEPVPVRYEEVAELGAVIEVVFRWDCDMHSKDCEPEVKARRLDVLFDPEHIGFSFTRMDYTSDNERTLHEMRGVRIFFQTVGRGSMIDFNEFILNLATTTSLLCLAPIIADQLMKSCFTHSRRYNARKYEMSPLFDTYMEQRRDRTAERKKFQKEEMDDALERDQLAFNRRLRGREGEDDDE